MADLLLIEDDLAIAHMLQTFLSAQGYQVRHCENAKSGLNSLHENPPDLLILDWMLPDRSGPKLVRQLRGEEALRDLPILMLTARSEEENKITGLEAGADDYLTKPVSVKELLARVRALLRRSQRLAPDNRLHLGRLILDPQARSVLGDGQPIPIRGKEFDLLQIFLQKPDRIFSRAQLLDRLWGHGSYVEERTVDVHIMRLRKLLKQCELSEALKTVRGIGYRLDKNALMSREYSVNP